MFPTRSSNSGFPFSEGGLWSPHNHLASAQHSLVHPHHPSSMLPLPASLRQPHTILSVTVPPPLSSSTPSFLRFNCLTTSRNYSALSMVIHCKLRKFVTLLWQLWFVANFVRCFTGPGLSFCHRIFFCLCYRHKWSPSFYAFVTLVRNIFISDTPHPKVGEFDKHLHCFCRRRAPLAMHWTVSCIVTVCCCSLASIAGQIRPTFVTVLWHVLRPYKAVLLGTAWVP